nr:MAG: hypothetical protein [Chemarfal virus 251]
MSSSCHCENCIIIAKFTKLSANKKIIDYCCILNEYSQKHPGVPFPRYSAQFVEVDGTCGNQGYFEGEITYQAYKYHAKEATKVAVRQDLAKQLLTAVFKHQSCATKALAVGMGSEKSKHPSEELDEDRQKEFDTLYETYKSNLPMTSVEEALKYLIISYTQKTPRARMFGLCIAETTFIWAFKEIELLKKQLNHHHTTCGTTAPPHELEILKCENERLKATIEHREKELQYLQSKIKTNKAAILTGQQETVEELKRNLKALDEELHVCNTELTATKASYASSQHLISDLQMQIRTKEFKQMTFTPAESESTIASLKTKCDWIQAKLTTTSTARDTALEECNLERDRRIHVEKLLEAVMDKAPAEIANELVAIQMQFSEYRSEIQRLKRKLSKLNNGYSVVSVYGKDLPPEADWRHPN